MFNFALDIGWRDLFDVLLVSVFLYKTFTFVRGTTAFQVLAVVLLLMGISLASQLLELNTVYWLVRNITGYLLLALVILFQPEIRKFLVSIGQNEFFKIFTKADEKQAELIDEVVKACVSLATRHTGALIVIERDTSVQNYADITVVLDAVVGKELLISIFQPSSPIHDGAVLIRAGRIHAAGCFLTVSMNPEIDKTLGTRHRAAIGITEQTDAVAIVVSEETGKMSVSIDGKIIQRLDSATLKKVLRNILAPKPKGAKSARRSQA